MNKIKIHNHYNTNSYYNDLIGVFDNDNDNDNINDIKPLIEMQTNNNNYYAIAVILNDYKKLMGDYNDLIISIICNK